MKFNTPHSWYNVREDDTVLFVIDSDGSTYVGRIDAGYYPGADALIRAINRVLSSMVGLAYSNITQKVTKYITEHMSFSVHSPSLRQIVGMHQDVYSISERDDAGRRVPLERGRVTVTLHFRRCKPSFFET